jgi:hypothetical protein
MSKLYIIDHLSDHLGDTAIAILSPTKEIEPGKNYKVSPIEVGFDYVNSVLDKFDEIEFIKDHDNYCVKLQQEELEIIYRNNITPCTKNLLDINTMNFFGCSHTAGIGHSNKTSFPDVLTSKLNIPPRNFGLPGKGNYDIEDLLTTYTINNAKLIIQFTDIYRVRYLNNGKLIQNGIYNIEHNHSVLFNEENLFFNFKKIVDRIVARLREGNNQFLLTYTNNIDNDWAIQANSFLHRYTEYCSAIGTQIDVAEDGAHYGIQSHSLWAERLYDKWIELYGKE